MKPRQKSRQRRSGARGRFAVALALVGLGLAAGGCSVAEKRVALPEPAPPAGALERADDLFAAARYGEAAAAYGDWLATHGSDHRAGRALFQQALAHMALARSGATAQAPAQATQTDSVAARDLLTHLVAQYPESSYAPAAALMLAWLSEAEQLRQRLDAIKKIDLGQPADGAYR